MTLPSLRRSRTHDDVSFSPPENRPTEWTGTRHFVHCRNGHVMNYHVRLGEDYQRLRANHYTGEVRVFARCGECKSWQMGVWDLPSGAILWVAIPNEATLDEVMGFSGKTPSEAVVEIIRQRTREHLTRGGV